MYELWFRIPYKNLIQSHSLKAALRPGDRRFPKKKGTKVGERVEIKILKKNGDESSGIAPQFDEFTTQAVITGITYKSLNNFKELELRYCSPDSRTVETAIFQLGLIYNCEFSRDGMVSLLTWEYTDERNL